MKIVTHFLQKKANLFSFILSLTAVLGSLYFSEILGYAPCKLCWIQRIFIYPLVFIFLIALIKKDHNIWHYVIPLNILGIIFAIYHYYTQVFSIETFCAINSIVDCSTKYFIDFGYINIPMMSLTVSSVILVLMLFLSKKNKQK